MSKLNAEELAAKRYAVTSEHSTAEIVHAMASGSAYAAAIREVAQPLADERDELRAICEALIVAHDWAIANQDSPISIGINYGHVAHDARAILAKHPKP